MAEFTTTTNMSLTKPKATPDAEARPGPTWALDTNENWDTVDEHDHSSGKGTKVTPAGLNINADVDMNSNGLTELEAARFQPVTVATTSAHTTSLFVSSVDNELYWRTSGGTAVQITSSTALNIAGVGGIGGDYTTSDALLNYVDADTLYQLLSDDTTTPDTWAGMSSGDLRVYEKSNVSNYVGIKSPAALAASYQLTLPAALPAAELAATIDASGNIAVADSSTPFSAYKYASRVVGQAPPLAANTLAVSGGPAVDGVGTGLQVDAGDIIYVPITGWVAGETIESVVVDYRSTITGTNLDLYIIVYDQDAATQEGIAATTADSTSNTLTDSGLTMDALAAGDRVYLSINANASSGGAFYLRGFSIGLASA